MSTETVIARLRATSTDAIVPANRLAVSPAVFDRLCRESEDGGLAGYGAPDAELHILKGDDALDALDDLLRDRAQTAGEFVGRDAWVLLSGEGDGGCDVWARGVVTAAD
jgi:hypothetical protein